MTSEEVVEEEAAVGVAEVVVEEIGDEAVEVEGGVDEVGVQEERLVLGIVMESASLVIWVDTEMIH